MSEYCTCATSFDGSCEIHDQITALKAQLAEITEQRDIAEANLARLQDRWDARPATGELEARLAEAIEARQRMEQKAAQDDTDWFAIRAQLAEAERELDDMHRVRLLLYAERDALRARLAEAEKLLTVATGIGLLPSGVPALPMAIRERIGAFLSTASQPPARPEDDCAECDGTLDGCPSCASLRERAAHQPTDALEKFARDLAAAQTPLDPAAAKVLRENLHDLYMDGGTSDNGSQPKPVRGFRDEPSIEERVFHASLMDGATPQPSPVQEPKQ